MKSNDPMDEIRSSGIEPGQVYRHFRLKELYVIISLAIDESDFRPLVVYRSSCSGVTYVRPLSSWFEIMDGATRYTLPDGSERWGKPRFSRVTYDS